MQTCNIRLLQHDLHDALTDSLGGSSAGAAQAHDHRWGMDPPQVGHGTPTVAQWFCDDAIDLSQDSQPMLE